MCVILYLCIYLLMIKQGAAWLRVHTVWRELWWGTRTRVRCWRWHHHQFLFHLHIFLQYHWLWDRDYRLFSNLSIFSDQPFVSFVWIQWLVSNYTDIYLLVCLCSHWLNRQRGIRWTYWTAVGWSWVLTYAQQTYTESKQLYKTGQVRALTVLLVGHLKGQVLLS